MARVRRQERLPRSALLVDEPRNEEGVKVLFYEYARKKGWRVKTAQQKFPDCIVVQQTPDGEREIRCEFEFKSSSFRSHRHPAAGCDWIVCWEHDWRKHPANLTIIELRREYPLAPRVWLNPVDAPQQSFLESKRIKWAVRNTAHNGDLMLMYRCAPEKCLRDVFVLETEISEGKRHPAWKGGKCFGGVSRCVCRLDNPLSLEDLRTVGITGRMQGNRDVTELWPRIYKLMASRNADARAALSKYAPKRSGTATPEPRAAGNGNAPKRATKAKSSGREFRVLSVRQPWAGLIIAGRKTVENRSWRPSANVLSEGARFAIHASGGIDRDVPPWVEALAAAEPLCQIHGAIIGTVEFAGILSPGRNQKKCSRTDCKWWRRGGYGWRLRNPKRLKFATYCKGRLLLWTANL